MKNLENSIGNRIRDLPACSVMPQPTAPPGAPVLSYSDFRTLGTVAV